MKKNLNRGLFAQSGFTLIELLVVIAVIGILASVVIVSVSSARNKATDKAIQTNMLTIRNQTDVYLTNNGGIYGSTDIYPAASSYNCTSGMFVSDPTLFAAVEKIRTYRGYDNIACSSTSDSYVVATQLKSTNDYYCVDSNSTGKIIDISDAPNGLIGFGSTTALNLSTSLCN